MSDTRLGEQDSTEVLARHGRSFHFASRLLPEPDATRVARLYRFCRYVDDLADEAPDTATAHAELRRVDAALAGDAHDPIVTDLLMLADECEMSLEPAHELLAGIRSDLGPVRVADEQELLRYCYRVAGTVGLMMCGVLGVDDPDAHPFAVDLGIGMQLTNIARDVAEDAARDRRYLPASVIGPVEPVDIVAPTPELRPRLAAGVEHLLDEAERRYSSGQAGLIHLPSRARQAVWVAARVYREIGERLRRRGCTTWDGRAVVPTSRKMTVAAGALVSERRARRHAMPVHDPRLHDQLVGLAGTNAPALVA